MTYRELEVTLISASDLKSVNLFTRMDVYAVASISGDPLTRQFTAPDRHGGSHPTWNATLRFSVPPTAAAAAGRCLHVLLRAERVLGDRDVGEVVVPLPDLYLAAAGADGDPGPQPAAAPRLASYYVYKVHRPGEPRGVLSLSYRFGPVVAPVGATAGKPENGGATTGYRGGERDPRAVPASEVSNRPQPPPRERSPPRPIQIIMGVNAHTDTQINRESPRTTSAPKAGFTQQDERQDRANLPAAANKPSDINRPEKPDHRLVSKPAPQQQNTRPYGHTQSNNNNDSSGKIDTTGHKASFPQDTTRLGAYGRTQSNKNQGKIDDTKAASFPRQDTTRAGAYLPAQSNNNHGKTDSFVHKAFPHHDISQQRMPDLQQGPKYQFMQQDKHIRAYAY